MTVFLRALYGPFGPFEKGAEVDWHFFGIRENNTMGRWAVRFNMRDRTWKTVNFPMNEGIKVGGKWVKAEVHPDFTEAYVPPAPMIHGSTYLTILKPRLREEDIAFASRAAIEAARR